MAGAQTTAAAAPRLVLALMCAVFVALAAAPAAMATSPAGDQYGQFLPGAGNGGGSASDSGGGPGGGTSASSTSGQGVTTVPVAPRSNASTSGGSSTGGDGSSHSSGQNGTSKHDGSTGGGTTPSTVDPTLGESSAHSVPQIASNAAGDGWIPFFIAALVALAAAAAALVYRNHRRTVQN